MLYCTTLTDFNNKAPEEPRKESIGSQVLDKMLGPLVPTTLFVYDKRIEQLEMHPGDELLCLGYPFGLAVNKWGFPILKKWPDIIISFNTDVGCEVHWL